MFATAIQTVSGFTRPIHVISRYYNANNVVPGAATMFFINAKGYALTCRHVADLFHLSTALPQKLAAFKAAAKGPRGKLTPHRHLRNVEKQFGFTSDTLIELQCRFINCVDTFTNISVTAHPTLDLALIHFQGFNTLGANTFPVFPKQANGEPRQGQFLCRLGFPFPEFNNFAIDPATDSIIWTNVGRIDTPQFPIEGMVTRHLLDPTGAIVGFEVSTPGLRGQSGGPAFAPDGMVYGVQSFTQHLDLDFDVDLKVQRGGHIRTVRESAVLHVGHCISAESIKTFLTSHNVSFQQA